MNKLAVLLLLTLLTFLSSVTTSLVAVWVESGAQQFGDVSPVGYGIVVVGALSGALTTLSAKLQKH